MCFSTILSRVLDKYFVYMPPTPLSNGPSVNKVLSCLDIFTTPAICAGQKLRCVTSHFTAHSQYYVTIYNTTAGLATTITVTHQQRKVT